MGKVYDSVQQILTECDNMLKNTTDCEFVDVNSLAKTLRDECAALKEMFDNDPGNESGIRVKKQAVERLAVRLEYFMSVRLNLYEDRQRLRKLAATLYTDCRALTLALNAKQDVSGDILVEWATNTQWALSFLSRSYNILFESTEDDDDKIKNLVINMKIVKERYNV